MEWIVNLLIRDFFLQKRVASPSLLPKSLGSPQLDLLSCPIAQVKCKVQCDMNMQMTRSEAPTLKTVVAVHGLTFTQRTPLRKSLGLYDNAEKAACESHEWTYG